MKNEEEFQAFKDTVQEAVPVLLNLITKHSYFLSLHPDKQTDFLCDIQETFEKKLGIELDPMCDNFEEIFDAWEAQDEFHQFMVKAGKEYRKSVTLLYARAEKNRKK